MKIQAYLMQQPMVQRYADRYHAPLANYVDHVPERYFREWVKTHPSLDELAFYYIGVQNQRPEQFTGILVNLEKYLGYDLPAAEGILTADYWERWAMDHATELLSEPDRFAYGRG